MRWPLYRFALAICLAAAPGTAQCAEWTAGFHANGTDGPVFALEVYDDGSGPALWVGGEFQHAGPVTAEGVVRWDGAQWSAVGAGLDGWGSQVARVRDLKAHDDGSGMALFACGRFFEAGGVSALGIARWDGAQWNPVGSTPWLGSAEPQSMALFDDGAGNGTELYVGGNTTISPGVTPLGVARWDGAAWHHVGGWGNSRVLTLAVWDDGSGAALYAAGYFTLSGGFAFDGIARWDGTSWSGVGGGLNDAVYDLAVFDAGSGPRLFAGGRFGVVSNPAIDRFAAWDGTTWSDPGCALGEDVYELEPLVAPGAIQPALHVGSRGTSAPWNNVLAWSGGACQPVGTGTNERIEALEVFDDGSGPALYAGGRLRMTGAGRADYIARWDGTAWAPLTVGRGAYDRLFALGVADVAGTGPALYADAAASVNGDSRAVGRLDANEWTRIGDTNGEVNALIGYDDGQGEKLVIGGTLTVVEGLAVSRVAAWDGASWTSLAGGIGPGEVETFGVFDLGAGDELIVGGQFQVPGARIASWSGTSWSPVGFGFDKRVKAVAGYDEGAGPRLFAGGHITRKLPLSGTNILMNRLGRWTGSDWTQVATNDLSDPVHALAVYDDGSGPRLVIGGAFSKLAGSPADSIVAWDGAAWQTLASGIQKGSYAGSVNALAVFDDGSGPALFAGGFFDRAGGVPVRNLARWDGTAWSDVGGGVDHVVRALAVRDDGLGLGPALFVGGWFKEAGGTAAQYIARWGRTGSCYATPYCTAGVSSGGCTAALTAAGVPSATAASAFDLTVQGAEAGRGAFVFYGLGGPKATPWGAGGSFHCVRGPLQRTGLWNSGGTIGQCDGGFSVDWNAYLAARPNALGNPFAAGQTVWGQGWIHDPLATKGGELSNAVEFSIQP